MNTVIVPFADDQAQQARDLLGAASELGYDREVVKVVRRGFAVPEDVASEVDKASKPKRRGGRRRRAEQAESQNEGGTAAPPADDTPVDSDDENENEE